ncbi:MAG: hypothetical protein KDE22_11800, partial [Rhodobacterales bacterium]|nr:hypothetical protein [Rhodobacterales bacterium]
LRGWLYPPHSAEAAAPAIVMAHGFSGVKEQYLDDYAAAFAAALMDASPYLHPPSLAPCHPITIEQLGGSDSAPFIVLYATAGPKVRGWRKYP